VTVCIPWYIKKKNNQINIKVKIFFNLLFKVFNIPIKNNIKINIPVPKIAKFCNGKSTGILLTHCIFGGKLEVFEVKLFNSSIFFKNKLLGEGSSKFPEAKNKGKLNFTVI
jgi:hypothetical protein